TLAGLVWSWRRNRQAVLANPEVALLPPQLSERILLGAVSLIGLIIALFCAARGKLLCPPWKELLVIWSVAWVGALYTFYLHRRAKGQTAVRPVPATEAIMLCALALVCGGWSFTT